MAGPIEDVQKGGEMSKLTEQKEARLKKIMDLVSDQALTKKEIAEKTGFSRSCCTLYVDILHDMRKIHIASYDVSKFATVERFLIGDLPDAENPGRVVEEKAEKRPAVVVNVRRDPFDVALFGEYRKAA